MSEPEAEAAIATLEKAGFPREHLSIKKEAIDPAHGIAASQMKEGAKGGAILGALFGGIVGCSLFLLADKIPSAAFNADLNPILGFLAGASIGALAIGLIGAISGRNAPQIQSGMGGEALTNEYRVLLVSSQEDAMRAMKILRQK
jgi:hypothetical protein